MKRPLQLAFVASIIVPLLGTAATQPAAQTSLPEQVLAVLGIRPGNGDPLPKIAEAVKDAGKPIDSLAAAILDAKPNRLTDEVLAHTSIADARSRIQEGAFRWDYGTGAERRALRRLLWSTAKAVAKEHAERAQQLGRAALLFEAMDEFPGGAYALNFYLRDNVGIAAAGISDEQKKELQELMRARMPQRSDAEAAARQALDRLFKHPEEVPKTVEAMDAWLGAIGNSPADRCNFAVGASVLLNHASASRNAESVKRARDAIDRWSATASDQYMKKWLKEALEVRTEPGRMNGMSVWKDGKWVETDTDGSPADGRAP